MGLHKLTAGDGYTYLTRQVAVHDATDRGHAGLGDYYAEKGESPGRWWGTGLPALDLGAGGEVTEAQMRNLFGEGRHPDAERLEEAALDAGASVAAAKKASQLGRLFAVYTGNAPEFQQELARRFTTYNYDQGQHWKTPVPAGVRARIRTDLATEMFAREHGRAPLDDRERAGFLAQVSRQQTTAVAGYDLTFTAVKSVSTLWALADPEVARQVEDAHHAAVEATLAWLEREVLFTRRGRGGVQQVKAAGLIAAVFTHRDARSSDPHLHTHVAISNKVQDASPEGGGRWLAVDGRVLYKANVTLSETYNTLLEAELIARLGVRFTARPAGPGAGPRAGQVKRAVREIEGIDPRLAATWSRRNSAIEARRRELAAVFQATHGRPPTAGESVWLAKQAWSDTRQAKHAPRSEADQRIAWRAEAVQVLGSEAAVGAMIVNAVGNRPDAPNHPVVTDSWVAKTAARVVETVQEDRATWQVWHLRAEVLRQAREHGVRPSDLEGVADRVVGAAITSHCISFNDPDPLTDARSSAGLGVPVPIALTRADGVSVYSLHGARLYTSRAVVDAERRILEAATRRGGRVVSDVRVGIAIAETAANGLLLNAAQQALVREMATSGRPVQLALAPAGTGKTAAMAVLTHAWRHAGGSVVGLAPSAVAAEQLGTAINPNPTTALTTELTEPDDMVRCETLAKLVWHINNGDEPAWMRSIDERTLVLLDEAGMAATTDLAAAIAYVNNRGGSIRLVGDDRQLASVAAGGVLRDIAHQVGAVTLSEVRRFLNQDGSLNLAEAGATLAVRDGDPAALGFYADHGRIHVGDLGTCADQAYAAWAADRATNRAVTPATAAGVRTGEGTGEGTGGRGGERGGERGGVGADSLLIAPTRELVAELNTRARNDRLAALATLPTSDPGRLVGRVLTLADGTQVSAGDPVITRRNERRLAISNTDWVKNGDRWTVTRVEADGSLDVRHTTLGKVVRLPADYAAEHVHLGYATTVHGAQGSTVGTCHVVLTGDEDRNLLYVALSRGQYANHLYLATATDGDPHDLIRPETLLPPTALDRLEQILRRDGSPVSATTALRDSTDPARLLHDAAARYHDALTTAAEQLLGPERLARIDQHAETLHDGLTHAAAWPTLRSHLALLAMADFNPFGLLTDAAWAGSLADARDPAAVLDARIDHHLRQSPVGGDNPNGSPTSADRGGPVPWLPGIPARLSADVDWGPYLAARHDHVLDRVAVVTGLAHTWSAATASAAPAWAQPFLEKPDTDLRAQLAVWRAVTDTPEGDLRPTGDPAVGAPGDHQAVLNRAVRAARPSYPFAQRFWYQALPEDVRQDPWITPLCQRLARLERAGLPVGDFIKNALNPAPSPNEDSGRPLPDQHQAAALWWRLVPHLGPTALEADPYSADLLTPTWSRTLIDLVGGPRATYLRHSPAWPALVAAVDESCHHHGWTPHAILAAALDAIPDDGSMTGGEVADAIVLRITALTDLPEHTPARPEERLFKKQAEPTGPINPTDPIDSVLRIANDPYAITLPWGNTSDDEAQVSSEFAFPDPEELSSERLVELNQLALDYYQACYPRSWAPGYLSERLGSDLVDHPTFTAGYAPPGPRSLLTHLTHLGASLSELEQAGLIRTRQRRDGTTDYVDVFRDRLVMPIRDARDSTGSSTPDGSGVIGFLGRRNPTKGKDDYAGPKYLNTKTTAVFTKGQALFGYAETSDLLAAGALPVLVEGPMDAYAITLGSGGTAVGLAPMGTALTTDQIKIIRRHLALDTGRDRIAVATDPDAAGWKAAQVAFWNLTAADLDPTHLRLPDGLDPADLLQTHGPAGIRAAINARVPLGENMLDQLLHTAGDWTDPEVRQQLLTEAARILAARGSDTWADSITRLNRRLHLSAGILEHNTVTESIDRDRNLAAYTSSRIAAVQARQRLETRPTAAPSLREAQAQEAPAPGHRTDASATRRDIVGPPR